MGLGTFELLAPVTPSKIVCVGLNYKAHAAEFDQEVPDEPLLFLKPSSAVIGPGEAVVLPGQSERVDYEAELALVVGRRCRQVQAGEAASFVAGYTCGNDVTARDLQARDGQWTRSKSFDTFCPLGPTVVRSAPAETGGRGRAARRSRSAARPRRGPALLAPRPARLRQRRS